MCSCIRFIITSLVNAMWILSAIGLLVLSYIDQNNIDHGDTKTQVGLSITTGFLIITIYVFGVFNLTLVLLKPFLWFSLIVIQKVALLYCWLYPINTLIEWMVVCHIIISVSQLILFTLTYSDEQWLFLWNSLSTSLCRPFGTYNSEDDGRGLLSRQHNYYCSV
ncbi:uncharacterized protein LOC128960158 [Oppia nitens]|uniref:uncharacterized protein LOC128960158 n=1 Tax=Oppia nitens TaxID=1686743 RepID=UPI0023DBA1C6|nr:uncharacterized protein LOC128960158 [Oppia nitens]